MNVKDAANEIKRTVSAYDIVSLYGYTPNKGGFIPCPFHNEKTGSLKVFKQAGKGWHCFGCGTGGSVIDFVIQHEGCTFSDAVKAIDGALGLHLTECKPITLDGYTRQNKAINDIDKYVSDINDILKEYERIADYNLKWKFRQWAELDAIPLFDRTIHQQNRWEQLKDECERYEDDKRQIEQLREEVRTWAITMKTKARSV